MKRKAIKCPHCKKLAWEQLGIDNKIYYFCPKHGPIILV